MRMRSTVLLLAVLGAACDWIAAERQPSFGQPPADSYAARSFVLKIDGADVKIEGAEITPAFFREARVPPILGRSITDEDQRAGTRVVMLGHALWTGRFASSPEIIGRTIDLDGQPAVVVGIVPRGFEVPAGAQIWVPK
jgi:hypothetical protein